jgi:hypothetical protein
MVTQLVRIILVCNEIKAFILSQMHLVPPTTPTSQTTDPKHFSTTLLFMLWASKRSPTSSSEEKP